MIPWDNCLISFAKFNSQILLYGTLIRCLYSWATPYIWWVTMLASQTCWNCAANAKLGTGFFLQLDLKLELGPPVSTLGSCAGRTLGGGTGMSGRMICGPEGDMWTLRWKPVGLFPSSSSVILGYFEGICLVSIGFTLWVIMEDLVTGWCCGGSTLWCRLAATLEKIPESCSITTI